MKQVKEEKQIYSLKLERKSTYEDKIIRKK
jgi:hypothetical protein